MTRRPPGSGRPEEGTPEYEWLYGPSASGPGPGADDVTRAMPAQGPARRGSARPTDPPDATKVMPTVSRPDRPASSRPRPTEQPAGRAAGRSPGRSTGRTAPPAAPPPARPQRSGGGFRPRFRLRWIKWAVLAWLVFLVAVPLWSWSSVEKVDADPGGDRPGDQGGTNYLLVGSDSRAGLTPEERKELGTGGDVGQRTDTIMLLHTGSGPNVLMSIPRDSIVEVPGHGTTKINAAYAYGWRDGGADGAAQLLVKTLENNTGLRIDKYVEIGLGGFVNVVDAVGGITICPKSDMKDPLANLDISKGCQHADGKTALGYARSRHTSGLGDIDRAKHQREVVSAVGDKAVSPWAVLNPLRYFRLNAAMPDFFTVSDDTGPLDMARFGYAMTRVDGTKGLTCGVPISDLSVRWDPARSKEFFGYLIDNNAEDIPTSLCTPSGLPK